MSVFDKFLDKMNLNDDDEDYYDDDDLYEDEEEEVPRRKSLFKKKEVEDFDEPDEEAKFVVKESKSAVKSSSKLTPMRSNRKGGGMEVCVIKPTSFEDSRDIVETLLSERTILLNMEGLDLGLAQRIIDVTSGACFAIGGTLQKVSNYIFIVTPRSVDISGDLSGIMDQFDFSGIQTGF